MKLTSKTKEGFSILEVSSFSYAHDATICLQHEVAISGPFFAFYITVQSINISCHSFSVCTISSPAMMDHV